MALTIDFSPAEEQQLNDAAREEGIEPAALVKKLVNQQLPLVTRETKEMILELLDSWEALDAQRTPAQVAEENRSWEQYKASMKAERDRAGRRGL